MEFSQKSSTFAPRMLMYGQLLQKSLVRWGSNKCWHDAGRLAEKPVYIIN